VTFCILQLPFVFVKNNYYKTQDKYDKNKNLETVYPLAIRRHFQILRAVSKFFISIFHFSVTLLFTTEWYFY